MDVKIKFERFEYKKAFFIFADSLRHTSAVAVFLAIVFLVITAGIAIAKWVQGTMIYPRLLPEINGFNSIWALFTVVPVLVTAYVCHFNGESLSRICFYGWFLIAL